MGQKVFRTTGGIRSTALVTISWLAFFSAFFAPQGAVGWKLLLMVIARVLPKHLVAIFTAEPFPRLCLV